MQVFRGIFLDETVFSTSYQYDATIFTGANYALTT